MLSRSLGIITAVSLVAFTSAAQKDEPKPDKEEPGAARAPLADLVTDTGTRVEFREPVDGRLIVVEEGGPGQKPAVKRDLAEKGDALAIYKFLAKGKPIPPGLQRAHERRQELQSRGEPGEQAPPPDLEPPDKGEPDPLEEPDGITERAMSGSSSCSYSGWEDNYCPRGSKYSWCWLGRTGTTTYTGRAGFMDSYVCARRGNVRMTFKVYEWGSWRTFVSQDVRQGRWAAVYGPWLPFGGWDRSQVSRASGDSYHHSGAGY